MDPFQKILVPTDFSERSELAVQSAAALARKDAASLHLLHVIRLAFLQTAYDISLPESVWEGLRKEMQKRLEDVQRELESHGDISVYPVLGESLQPAEAIVRCADHLEADLVVMATHARPGLAHALLGSVTERTVRTSRSPVLVVKGAGLADTPVRRILLATDFSKHAKAAQALAVGFAQRFDAPIDVLHVLDETPDFVRSISAEIGRFEDQARSIASKQLDATVDEIKAEQVPVIPHFERGKPVDAVVSEAERLGSDLIVMGTHGWTGFSHWALGSVAERVLRFAGCSVLTTHVSDD